MNAELEALIEKISREVISRINAETTGGCSKKALVLIPPYAMDKEAYLRRLIDGLPGYEISVLAGKGSFESLSSLDGDIRLLDIGCESAAERTAERLSLYDAVYCIAPGFKLLRNILDYNDDGLLERFLLQGLAAGKKVELLMDYKWSSHASDFLEKTKNILEGITHMGIRVNTLLSPAPQKGRGGLITEKDVDMLLRGGTRELLCESGCLITPLARDRASEAGMKIIINEG